MVFDDVDFNVGGEGDNDGYGGDGRGGDNNDDVCDNNISVNVLRVKLIEDMELYLG